MTTIDIRNDTWESVRGRVTGNREAVWLALERFGPATTRALAAGMEWDILHVRPRVTELLDLRLVRLVGRCGDGGIYEAVPEGAARQDFLQRQAWARQHQEQLQLL